MSTKDRLRTPGYLIRKELQRQKNGAKKESRIEGVRIGKQIRRRRGSRITRICLEEKKKRALKGIGLSI